MFICALGCLVVESPAGHTSEHVDASTRLDKSRIVVDVQRTAVPTRTAVQARSHLQQMTANMVPEHLIASVTTLR